MVSDRGSISNQIMVPADSMDSRHQMGLDGFVIQMRQGPVNDRRRDRVVGRFAGLLVAHGWTGDQWPRGLTRGRTGGLLSLRLFVDYRGWILR
jgi:hypothetical protein